MLESGARNQLVEELSGFSSICGGEEREGDEEFLMFQVKNLHQD